jgi:hypothetical protein
VSWIGHCSAEKISSASSSASSRYLASLLLLIGLLFGHRIAGGAAAAPLFVTGLITFLIVFGMGVAPLFDQPGATFAQRLFNIGIACVYAFAALAFLDAGTRREMPLRVRSAATNRTCRPRRRHLCCVNR